MPTLIFGILSALSGPVLGLSRLEALLFICRAFLVFVWGWINLLVLCLNNQRRPEAVEEDKENKPWRPLPSKRMEIHHANCVFWASIPVNFISSCFTGGFLQSVLLTFLNFWYNDGDASGNPFFRNLINACGFMLYSSAALEIMASSSSAWKSFTALGWILLIGGIVGTTVHCQDLRDQVGDRVRGRWTLPLIIGDRLCRITIAFAAAIWSFFCPAYWHLPWSGYLLPVGMGTLLIIRLAFVRTSRGDDFTFKIWGFWLMSIYTLPLLKYLQRGLEINNIYIA